MIAVKIVFIWLVLAFTKVTERFGLKNVFWTVSAILLILFGDTIVPAIFHILHIMWEMVEYVIEHFLESMFHLTPRQAEMIVAWMGILTMIGVGIRLLWAGYRHSLILSKRLGQYLAILKADFEASPLKLGLTLSLVSLSTYGASFLFF